jgi:site-specific recombinase XerD
MTGPLAPFVDRYRERLEERRYSRLSVVNLERQVARMSRWLEAEGLGVERLSEERIDAFVSL